ncbi:Glycosyl transferases group 1 [Geodermatophilus africanus]|uniref:Glycosyl transferases group 1 n=1 Tax=Geodermatophilus africanus TaxID=1137993 RepID=A0A1H3BDJ4_9ACTN|nr:glycosyltransferase [Geodermatophilus africanus]SDX40023.1 Glycosyl transferases group 1 [Geodermatophilus africanus]
MATSAVAPRRLLCVAPLAPAGGVDTLLTAFGMLADDHPELSAEVVGTGPLARVLRSHADYLGLAERVGFRGRLAPPAVRSAVRDCAVLVLPHRHGTAAVPAAGTAVLEALEAACPVVATPLAPYLDLLDAGTVVPPDDPTAMAQALVSVLTGTRARAAGAGPGAAGPGGASRPEADGHLLRRAWLRVLG